MSDKELLELAAKAAGYKLSEIGGRFHFMNGDYLMREWSPLTDDGDALRLAVKLQISIDPYKTNVYCIAIGFGKHVEENKGDPYAATRRAIVRAAAEIGKGMQ